jgi:hypothetical protein
MLENRNMLRGVRCSYLSSGVSPHVVGLEKTCHSTLFIEVRADHWICIQAAALLTYAHYDWVALRQKMLGDRASVERSSR